VPSSLAISRGSLLRWGLKHSALVGKAGAAAVALAQASTMHERWLIVRPLGDELAPALDELLTAEVGAFSAQQEADLEAQLLAALNTHPEVEAFSQNSIQRPWLDAALQLIQLLLPLLIRR
jgi:hypothetical protein